MDRLKPCVGPGNTYLDGCANTPPRHKPKGAGCFAAAPFGCTCSSWGAAGLPMKMGSAQYSTGFQGVHDHYLSSSDLRGKVASESKM